MQRLTSTSRACRKVAVLTAALTIAAVGTVPAFAAPGAVGAPRPLAVSVPSEAASLGPGATGTIPIRIVNPGSDPVTVRVTGHKVEFGDNGRVTVAGADAQWNDQVDFPAAPITVAPDGYRDVGVTVHVPAGLSPDLYFIGFLVTPTSSARSSLTYVNQIGSYVTIDVPGPRTRVLAADLDVPGFAFGASVAGALRVHNVGKAAAIYWGENDTTASPGSSSPVQQRLEGSLLPIGRSRVIAVSAKPSFLVARVTMHVRIFYPGRTTGTTTQIDVTKHVWVVQPAAVVLLAAILLAVAVVLIVRRRKRRPRRPAARRQPVQASTAARVDRMLENVRTAVRAD